MFVGAFAAIVGGRAARFSVSFFSAADFFFFFRVFFVGVDSGLAIRMFWLLLTVLRNKSSTGSGVLNSGACDETGGGCERKATGAWAVIRTFSIWWDSATLSSRWRSFGRVELPNVRDVDDLLAARSARLSALDKRLSFHSVIKSTSPV
jgi:hypothetical protein